MDLADPPFIWFNGAVVPWEDARVHVWSEVAVRGASVFEGIRCYWHPGSGRYYLLALDEHFDRLAKSARLLKYPMPMGSEGLERAISSLLLRLDYREHAYVRPTVYAESSHRGGAGSPNITMGAYVVAFRAPRGRQAFDGIRCCVSSWRRLSDLSLTPRVKAGAGFLSLRLPRLEAAERQVDEVILLNERDTVAEASGASIFLVRDGVAVTPPVTLGILEGITRRRVATLLLEHLGIPTVEREVGRTELYVADEVFTCSTLHEIQPVVEIDGYPVGQGTPGPVAAACRDRYLEHCQAGPAAPPGWLTPVVAPPGE